MVYELRPAVLPEEGLVQALNDRLAAVEGRSGITTTLEAGNLGVLPPHFEEGLYGIAREALNNALKHGDPTVITVRINRDDDIVQMEIINDGADFDVEEGWRQGGLGLRGMAERAESLGGRFTLTSDSEQGTQIMVEVTVPTMHEDGIEAGFDDS